MSSGTLNLECPRLASQGDTYDDRQCSSAFLDVQSFVREEPEAPPAARSGAPAWSPFLSVYESDEGENPADEPVREAYSTLVNDLYDEEFDESLFELLTSARGLHQDHLASGHSLADADRIVTQHFSQLMRESESMLDAMARELGSRDAVTLDREMDLFAERYAPASALEPEFQDFLGKLVKKIGKGVRSVAKTAVKGIATLGLGPILNRIKALVRPLLNKVLQKAIGRLPESRAACRAQRWPSVWGFVAEAAAPRGTCDGRGRRTAAAGGSARASTGVSGAGSAAPPPEMRVRPSSRPPAPRSRTCSSSSTGSIAEAMLSDDEVEFELEAARARAASNGAAAPVFTDLDQARERLDARARTPQGRGESGPLRRELPARGAPGAAHRHAPHRPAARGRVPRGFSRQADLEPGRTAARAGARRARWSMPA